MTEQRDRPLSTEDLAGAGRQESRETTDSATTADTADTADTGVTTGTDRPDTADTAYRQAQAESSTGAHAAERPFGTETAPDTGARSTWADQTAGDTTAGRPDDESAPLLSSTDTDGFRARWRELQSLFVDDPRKAVHAADELVAEVMQTVATTFGDRKHQLEGQWQRGEEVETEHLRLALRQYRSFFNRLLST
jgi:hypothetical protein